MTIKSKFSFAKSAAESVGRGQSASKKGAVVLELGAVAEGEGVAAIAVRATHRNTRMRASSLRVAVPILAAVNL
jgi:hypothetical protein